MGMSFFYYIALTVGISSSLGVQICIFTEGWSGSLPTESICLYGRVADLAPDLALGHTQPRRSTVGPRPASRRSDAGARAVHVLNSQALTRGRNPVQQKVAACPGVPD